MGILGIFFYYQFIVRDRTLIRPVVVYNTQGAASIEYNPRIAQLVARMKPGNIYDRKGVLLATSFADSLDHYQKTYRHYQVPGRTSRIQKRYYPFGEHLFFMLGDYNNKNLFFEPEPIPDWVYELPLTIVQESTYGYMNSSEIKETFVDNIIKCVSKGGTIVIPAFALGRMQEVLYKLKVLQDLGTLPLEVDIYVDGKLGIMYTGMCKNGMLGVKKEMREFLPSNVVFVDKTTRGMLLQDNAPKIIVTTSGMGSHGPAETYIPSYITKKNALIQFTGYVAEGTLGRELKEAPKGETIKIRGVLYKKEAEIEYTNEFSAHAKADEMISFLQKFEKLNLVLVNHGEAPVKDIFAKRILREVDTKNVAILGQYFHRVNPYGLVTSKSTKFL